MKLVIFGLTVSSSWGNGHATLWRGLISAMARRGHEVVFFERDVPYYAAHRDLHELPRGASLRLYSNWSDLLAETQLHLADADAAIVTSYCPDGIAAGQVILSSQARLKVFYDLDTPVTLSQLRQRPQLTYLDPQTLPYFDLVLSYTGGEAVRQLRDEYKARRVEPLYGHVDPQAYRPVESDDHYASEVSYLGTYAQDRQQALEQLFVEPARQRPAARFMIAGAQYPAEFPWASNIFFVRHLPPERHPAFYCSSRLTLNVTRHAMAAMGYCPSGRLFEAAACGAPVISDDWEGLLGFFSPGEILIAHDTAGVLQALELSDRELKSIGTAARERVLNQHTADHRADELEQILSDVVSSSENHSHVSING